jgi:ATP synthase protein I
MAQPLLPEPPRPPEAPDPTLGLAELDQEGLDREGLDQDGPGGHPHIRLLQEPPERKVTGPRPRPGLRKQQPSLDDTPMPARGAGMTIVSYLIAGIVAYGGIGWLIGRAVHLPVLAPAGMVAGLAISMGLVIYRYGRSTPPRIRRFAPKPEPANEPNEQADDNDARGTDR